MNAEQMVIFVLLMAILLIIYRMFEVAKECIRHEDECSKMTCILKAKEAELSVLRNANEYLRKEIKDLRHTFR
jgi:cell division protein FtsB